MAKCRYCGEFLEDDEVHACTWRDLVRRLGGTALAMGVGVICSLFALYYFDCEYSNCNPSNTLIVLGTAAGMVIGQAVWAIAWR